VADERSMAPPREAPFGEPNEMKCYITSNIDADVRAIVHESINLIVVQANTWVARGYPETFVERAIELSIGAAEAELRTTFTPEFSATIAVEIREAVLSQLTQKGRLVA
jgi:hypothetical protein